MGKSEACCGCRTCAKRVWPRATLWRRKHDATRPCAPMTRMRSGDEVADDMTNFVVVVSGLQ